VITVAAHKTAPIVFMARVYADAARRESEWD
jgi:hypothetical protein